jgi:hypothetical protein
MMRPTTASASKTHDKPASPPRKSTKAPVSAIQKGKKKVEEVAAKAKDSITSNGHHDEEAAADGTVASEDADNSQKVEPSDQTAEVQESATADAPTQDAETPAAEPQTALVTNEPVH